MKEKIVQIEKLILGRHWYGNEDVKTILLLMLDLLKEVESKGTAK